jgi:hypothetical protein
VVGAQVIALEIEVQRLRQQLDIEEQFRTDTEVRYFKKWLRSHDQPQDSDFAKRFLADTRLPQHASRSLYEARLRLHDYSAEDILLFQGAWKAMLFTQSRGENRDSMTEQAAQAARASRGIHWRLDERLSKGEIDLPVLGLVW